MKFRNIIFSMFVFIFAGCGTTGTDPQGAMGNYKTFGGKNLSGVWDRYYVENYKNQVNTLEFDEQGSVYVLSPNNSSQKTKVATYDYISDKKLKLITQNSSVVFDYFQLHESDNSCFYVLPNGNQASKELWCKRAAANQQENGTIGGQSLVGVWDMYYDKTYNNQIDTNKVSAMLEFDEYGNIYAISDSSNQKTKVATYDFTQDNRLRLSSQNGTAIVEYLQAHESDSSCFYAKSTYNNQAETELWCKRATTNDQNNDPYSVIPPLAQGTGLDIDIRSYFFPYNTLRDGYTYKDYLVTRMNSNGQMIDQKTVVKHYLEGNKNANGDSIISVFEDNALIKRNIVEDNKITVYTYDKRGISTGSEQYATLMRLHEDLLRNENGACVLEEKLDNLYLSNIVPSQADPRSSTSPSHYGSVLHFRCGTSNGVRIDRYYADSWGEIAEIYHYQDGSVGYSVFDMQTDQNP